MAVTEDILCGLFADRVAGSEPFRHWLLGQTKFARFAESSRLLDEEQRGIRPRKFWWRHWWTTIAELNSQREVDVFLVFENTLDKRRFALLVENKLASSNFQPGQAESYSHLGREMLRKPAFLDAQDFESVLIAPLRFRSRHAERAALFDRFISHEAISSFIPEFAQS